MSDPLPRADETGPEALTGFQESALKESAKTGPVIVVAPDRGAGDEQAASLSALPAIWLGVALAIYMLYRFGRLRVAERVKRWLPLGYVAILGAAILTSGALIIRTGSLAWLLFSVALLALVVFLNASWLRSILAGVALTLEHHLEVGDSIRLGALEGDVMHFGLRSTRLRATDGTLHDIPHEHLLNDNVANLSGDGSDSACAITISIPYERAVEEAMARVAQVALLSPLASPRHKPEVFLQGKIERDSPIVLSIRGYAFDPNYQEHYRSDVLRRLSEAFRDETSTSPGALGDEDDIAR